MKKNKCRRLSKNTLIDQMDERVAGILRASINSSNKAFDFLADVLDKKLSDLDKELESKTMFESPAFSYKVASILGAKKEIHNLKILISETEE